MHVAGGLLGFYRELQMGYSVPCVHYCVVVAGYFTPGSIRVDAEHTTAAQPETIPFLGLPINQRGQGLTDDASIYLHFRSTSPPA